MSGNNIARKIQRRAVKAGNMSITQYATFRRRPPTKPGFRYHATKGFRVEKPSE
jgi:hypothetical protein